MGDLADALREAGHEEIAKLLEQGVRRPVAPGRARCLADALVTGENKLTSEEELELDRINREVGGLGSRSGGGLT